MLQLQEDLRPRPRIRCVARSGGVNESYRAAADSFEFRVQPNRMERIAIECRSLAQDLAMRAGKGHSKDDEQMKADVALLGRMLKELHEAALEQSASRRALS